MHNGTRLLFWCTVNTARDLDRGAQALLSVQILQNVLSLVRLYNEESLIRDFLANNIFCGNQAPLRISGVL
jgi:hypothetical protein